MNYPLKWYHWAGRELMCFFLGHQWLHAKTYKTQYYEQDLEEVPYSLRKRGRGNYMWDTYAWWEFRCPRCRVKTKHWPWYPWYVNLWRGLCAFGRHVQIVFECLFIDETEVPLYKRLIVCIPLMLVFGIEGLLTNLDWKTIHFPVEITSNMIVELHEYMDSKT